MYNITRQLDNFEILGNRKFPLLKQGDFSKDASFPLCSLVQPPGQLAYSVFSCINCREQLRDLSIL